MVWPIVAAAGIAAAAQIGSSLNASRAASSATKQGRSFALHQGNIDFARQYTWREDNWRREDQQYQRDIARADAHLGRTVQQAKDAGLHPLFALGAGGQSVMAQGGGEPYTPTQRDPTYPPTGSAGGSGLAAAGEAVARGVMKYGSLKRGEEMYQLQKRLVEQQVQSNDIDLMAQSSMNMRLQEELLRNPTQAQAFSEAAVDKNAIRALERDLKQRLGVRTPKGATLVGPYGGKYNVPHGVTPQETWEALVGESSDIAGVGIGARMMLERQKEQKRAAAKKRRRKYKKGPRRNW